MNKYKEDTIWDKIEMRLGLWGIRIGTFLVVLPIVLDIVLKGVRSGENIKVCMWGVICQVIGLIFCWIGNRCEKSF